MSKHNVRDEKTGRYEMAHTRVCTCGAVKGVHDSAKPYPMGDATADIRDLPPCAGFKWNKNATVEEQDIAIKSAAWLPEGWHLEG